MKELYTEGVAIHGGPEPCVGDPQGRSEALDRGARRPDIEPRNGLIWGADALNSGGRQHRWRRFREPSADPTGSENLCMRAISPGARTGRSRGRPFVADDAPPRNGSRGGRSTGCGPRGEGRGRNPSMHGHGKSDRPVVPTKPPNNAASAAAEVVEERGLTKGNAASKTRTRHRAGRGALSALDRVRRTGVRLVRRLTRGRSPVR
jgi:RNA-directed DNA polymerase